MLDEIRLMASRKSPQFMAFTKTWLDDSISDNEFAIDSYRLFHRDRSRHGGGVCIYVSESLPVTHTTCDDQLELLWVRVLQPGGHRLLLGVYYCKHGTDTNLQLLENALFSIKRYSDNTILLGDFNTDLLDQSSSANNDLTILQLGFGLTRDR